MPNAQCPMPYFLPFLVVNTVVNIISIPPTRIAIASPPVIKSSKLLFSIVNYYFRTFRLKNQLRVWVLHLDWHSVCGSIPRSERWLNRSRLVVVDSDQ